MIGPGRSRAAIAAVSAGKVPPMSVVGTATPQARGARATQELRARVNEAGTHKAQSAIPPQGRHRAGVASRLSLTPQARRSRAPSPHKGRDDEGVPSVVLPRWLAKSLAQTT